MQCNSEASALHGWTPLDKWELRECKTLVPRHLRLWFYFYICKGYEHNNIVENSLALLKCERSKTHAAGSAQHCVTP